MTTATTGNRIPPTVDLWYTWKLTHGDTFGDVFYRILPNGIARKWKSLIISTNETSCII